MKLTSAKVKSISTSGMHPDGQGLYLCVRGNSKSWVLRYSFKGKRRDMGLGSANTVTLGEARDRARKLRVELSEGKDPIAIKSEQGASKGREQSFAELYYSYVEIQSPSWRSKKQKQIWLNSFDSYVKKEFGHLPVNAITREMVIDAFQKIWAGKYDTAKRTLGRVERVFDYAAIIGKRTGDNPARWRNCLSLVFPLRKRKASNHMPAMPWADLPDFYAKLATLSHLGAIALRFKILTVSRTSPVIEAVWDEFDFEKHIWTIPAERMKTGQEHQVPLCDEAISILRRQKEHGRGEYVFTGRYAGRPISKMTMLQIMRRFGYEYVPHGFRSSFKDWASEMTEAPNEVTEMALAHAISSKVEAAYRRGNLLEKRIKLMKEWEDFVTSVARTRA